MASDDGGRSWTPRGRITNDPEGNHYYNETAVYQCESGKLVAFMRVEQDPDRRSHTSVSHDWARAWGADAYCWLTDTASTQGRTCLSSGPRIRGAG